MTTLSDAAAAYQIVPGVVRRPVAEREALVAHPKFGTVFTDHMARARWTHDGGWADRRVEAYGPLHLEPAAAVLHYAQEIFEGLKAYRWDDGSVWAFRPQMNARRMAASAERLGLPVLSEADFLGSIEALVNADLEWVPSGAEMSLYLRPFMFASEPFIGVRAAHQVDYIVIAAPVGAYFAKGVAPVSIWVERNYHRAGPGGTGAAKCGGNYAASLLPQMKVADRGYEQVCFLDTREQRYLEELGGMNVFAVHKDGTLITPELTGTILPGVTRDSILALMRAEGREVSEHSIELSELIDDIRSGEVTEVFACGTAAVLTPIGRLGSEDFEVTVGDGEAGPLTMEIRRRLTDIQNGRAADPFGWMHRLA